MKTLNLCIRDEYYKINKQGEIFGGPNNIAEPSGNWKFLGISTHHWHNRIIHRFADIWENPELAINGYLWDIDHGTVRQWGGSYFGSLPRIISCYF